MYTWRLGIKSQSWFILLSCLWFTYQCRRVLVRGCIIIVDNRAKPHVASFFSSIPKQPSSFRSYVSTYSKEQQKRTKKTCPTLTYMHQGPYKPKGFTNKEGLKIPQHLLGQGRNGLEGVGRKGKRVRRPKIWIMSYKPSPIKKITVFYEIDP